MLLGVCKGFYHRFRDISLGLFIILRWLAVDDARGTVSMCA